MGAHGQNLMRRPDINLPSFADREANAAGPRYNTNYLRPYKGYANIEMGLSDANSSYNALQVFLSKRRGDLSFTLNYTLGRAYDNGSGNFDNPADGYEDLDYYWGPSDFDRTHIFVATWSYSLPFFRNNQGLLGNLLGGWQVSGITRYQTGAPITVLGNTSIGGRRADYTGGEIYLDERINPTTGVVQWINPAAFAPAPEGRRRQQPPAARSAGRRTPSGTSRCARSSGSPATSGCRSRRTSSTPSTASTGATRTTARPPTCPTPGSAPSRPSTDSRATSSSAPASCSSIRIRPGRATRPGRFCLSLGASSE